ncbi:reverse transcriptase [Apostichopus japonicus]|uniref:Reverse transcriptase n=1 Tax=Stichopus japonicus TaxID=307972 RepID=A0A2G8LEQ7_STIJA|nr:reverse transcriptase [Apostichopus japonicus]
MDPGPWVLGVITRGYPIEFSRTPPEGGGGKDTPVPTDLGQRFALESELHALVAKRAIVEATEGEDHFPLVLLPNVKKDGSWRPILNLKPLNKGFVRPTHFRMETLAIIIPNLAKDMWAASVDLKDAYLHIPVKIASQNFLAFSYKGRTFNSWHYPSASRPRRESSLE